MSAILTGDSAPDKEGRRVAFNLLPNEKNHTSETQDAELSAGPAYRPLVGHSPQLLSHGDDVDMGADAASRWEKGLVKTGIEIIARERDEQITKHRWLPQHDDEHTDGSLRVVAAVLACDGTDASVADPLERGSDRNHWGLREKLKGDDNRVHRLAVAGALIAAEIDRLQRAALRAGRKD